MLATPRLLTASTSLPRSRGNRSLDGLLWPSRLPTRIFPPRADSWIPGRHGSAATAARLTILGRASRSSRLQSARATEWIRCHESTLAAGIVKLDLALSEPCPRANVTCRSTSIHPLTSASTSLPPRRHRRRHRRPRHLHRRHPRRLARRIAKRGSSRCGAVWSLCR